MERKIHIYPTKSEFVTEVTKKIVESIKQAIDEKGISHIALAGGKTPREIYAHLAKKPYNSWINWPHVHIFWGDERTVPPNHPDSNFDMVKKALLAQISIPEENIHRIRGEIVPDEAAIEYTALLHQIIKGKPPRFDLILLGVGEDGHTASLFPNSKALDEFSQLVKAEFISKLNTWRVTLTLSVINAAKEIIFLVSGRDKADIVKRVIEAERPTKNLPATMVNPENGTLHWMLDAEAASLLNF